MEQLYQRDSLENDRNSYTSSQLDTYSTLSESKALIVENLDGTYCQAVNAKGNNEKENAVTVQDNRFEDYPRHRILYVVDDDEIAFYSGMFELPTHVDDFLHLFLKHQRYFTFFLFFVMVVEGALCTYGYFDRERATEQLMRTYKSSAEPALESIYLSAIVGEIIYMVIYYFIGFLAVYKRSVKIYGWFGSVSLIGLIFQMVLAYANRFEISIFLLRFLGFIYSRFLNQLLVSLLLLPR